MSEMRRDIEESVEKIGKNSLNMLSISSYKVEFVYLNFTKNNVTYLFHSSI